MNGINMNAGVCENGAKTMKREIGRVEGSNNNYIPEIYFPKFSLIPKIDLATLSNIHPKEQSLVERILIENGFRVISDLKIEKVNYDMKRRYSFDNEIFVDLLHGFKGKYRGRPTLLLTIHDPFHDLLVLFDQAFKYHEIYPKLSKIELALDFYTDNTFEVFNFLINHLLLKYQKSNSGMKKTTFYTNNIRKSVKGIRVYPKPKKGKKEFVRMELVLSRQKIYELGLELPLTTISQLDLSKFFEFRYLDKDRLSAYLIWWARDRIKKLNENKRFKNYGDIYIRQLESITRCYNGQESFMKIVEALRSGKFCVVPNFSRFLVPLKEFNDYFNKIWIEQGVL
jgi:hypothetical protein